MTNKKSIMIPIVCNKCGVKFYPGSTCLEWENQMEFHHYEHIGGYCSKIGDMVKISFNICDDCLIEFMVNMKVAPIFEELQGYDEYEGQTQIEYEEWLDEKREEIRVK